MGLGIIAGRVTEPLSDLTLGFLHSRPVKGDVRGVA